MSTDAFDWGTKLPALHGDGVSLRALGEADLPALFEIFGDPEVMRYGSRGPFVSADDAREYLRDIREGFAARRLFQWGITVASSDSVVGTCTIFGLDREHRRCELGFFLARRFWGQGIAFRALGALLRFAFDELALHRIEADADPRNERSLRLLERLGFRREGLLRERYLVGGELQDAVVFGLLRRDSQP
jgi:ribosomal-protein-alanine N-acetyltransferase